MTDAVSHQALSGLIGSIYDCTLDPSRWEQALADIMAAMDCHLSALTVSDIRDNRLLLHKAIGLAREEIEQAAKHLPEIHAMITNALASGLSPDEPFVVSRHFPAAYVERSPFFQNWERPTGTVDSMRLCLMHTPTHDAGFGVGRNEQQGLITDREIELGRLLLPHLRRAVMISNLLDISTIAGAHLAEALDALRCAVMLTNEHGAVMHANRAAERMLSDRGGPIQTSRGVLQVADPSAAAELNTAIALAAGNEAAIGKAGLAIRLNGPDAPPLFAHVLPLTGSDFRTRLQPAAVAAVFLGARPDAQEGADAVAAAFGLTPAETRVLASLFAGRTLAETAAALGVAGTTAKTHLEHIFLKTGVTRQADLIRMWMGLIPLTRMNELSLR